MRTARELGASVKWKKQGGKARGANFIVFIFYFIFLSLASHPPPPTRSLYLLFCIEKSVNSNVSGGLKFSNQFYSMTGCIVLIG